jgi:hypothetical protein
MTIEVPLYYSDICERIFNFNLLKGGSYPLVLFVAVLDVYVMLHASHITTCDKMISLK